MSIIQWTSPKFPADIGASAIIAPFASSVKDLQGANTDINIRFIYQLTISIPQSGNLSGLTFLVDFTPGFDFGFGFGGGLTGVLDFDYAAAESSPCP